MRVWKISLMALSLAVLVGCGGNGNSGDSTPQAGSDSPYSVGSEGGNASGQDPMGTVAGTHSGSQQGTDDGTMPQQPPQDTLDGTQ
jgi:hypothetical protein